MRSNASDEGEIPWQEAAFALQRKTDRKRALDALLDAAAQDLAAHKDQIEQFIEEGPSKEALDDLAERRESRRNRIARAAVREYRRRQSEIGRIEERDKKEP